MERHDVDAVELAAGPVDARGVESQDAQRAGRGAHGEDEPVVPARRVARRPQRAGPPRRHREGRVRAAHRAAAAAAEWLGAVRGDAPRL